MTFDGNFNRGLGNTEKAPSKMMMSSTMGRGFQLFKKENIWKHFDWTNQNSFGTLKHVFPKEQILFHRTFTYSEIDAVPESEDFCQGTLLHFEKDDYKVIR